MSKFLVVFALAATCAWAAVQVEDVSASKFQVEKQAQGTADNVEKSHGSVDSTVERWEHLDSAKRGPHPNSFGETTVCSGMALTEHFAAHDLPLVRHGETGVLEKSFARLARDITCVPPRIMLYPLAATGI
jgi:hypothetical protein